MSEFEIIRHRQMQGLSVFMNTVEHRTPHMHAEWEILWVVKNALLVSADSRETRLDEGQIVVFAPGEPHAFRKEDKPCTFLCFQISPDLLSLTGQFTMEQRCPHQVVTPEEMQCIRTALQGVAEHYITRPAHYQLYCAGHCTLVLYRLLRRLQNRSLTPEEAAGLRRRNARLSRLLDYVDENYMRKLRLTDFAQAEGCSVGYLSHFFKEATGLTFQEYVNTVRFNSACKRIASGETRMLDICIDCGFSDYRYFVRTFRANTGLTPEAYSRHSAQSAPVAAPVRRSLHSVESLHSPAEMMAVLRNFSQTAN